MEITIQIDAEHAAQLAYIQQRSHLDPAAVINHSIEQEYAKLQAASSTPLQIFEEAGLIGCLEGTPNLSVNYKSIISDYIAEKYQSTNNNQ
jgi:hypothetical protein